MNKKLLQSVREYKKQSIIAPLLVTLEVLMEVLIPLEMAKIIDIGIAEGNLGYIIQRGLILVIMAMMSLFFGVQAGNFAAIAGAGYAKNLRHDIYYKVQDFSFKNIDHFSTSGLVTRMTTDITNPDGLYDEYPSACKSSDYDRFILDHDADAQQKSRTLILNRHPGARWNAVIYCKESPSTFHQGV
mgnify:CR=1 FL=1